MKIREKLYLIPENVLRSFHKHAICMSDLEKEKRGYDCGFNEILKTTIENSHISYFELNLSFDKD